MRTGNSLRKVLALLLGLVCASVALAEPVARVLLAKGESQLERQGQRQGLTAGALLEPGDTLLVGERAAVQGLAPVTRVASRYVSGLSG